MTLPPLDAHAHVDPRIAARDLLALRSVVLVALRTMGEFDSTASRNDPLAVWGLGAHPGVPEAFDAWDADAFASRLASTPLVSEVGLDRRSSVPAAQQSALFAEVLAMVARTPRVVSVHSAGRSSEVLDLIEANPSPGLVLHWWRGTRSETERAVELGCWFSLNARDDDSRSVLRDIPRSRVLTETDHPSAGSARPPGDVLTVERRLGPSARQTVWSNFAQLLRLTGTQHLWPSRIVALGDHALGESANQQPHDRR